MALERIFHYPEAVLFWWLLCTVQPQNWPVSQAFSYVCSLNLITSGALSSPKCSEHREQCSGTTVGASGDSNVALVLLPRML